ncbi:PilW family protein [Pseudomonas sp.]|uniref:PilW family protein n=1 Tax=Pseudomonas sp. TaxID=306 RepID=UPI00272D2592|nr:PilW family protein [Pseudomonas sp.]
MITHHQPKQKGFSLIELMIALTISLLIMAAILKLFLDISLSNDELAKTNAQIENGRFAIQLLQQDLMHAGFWDGYIAPFDNPVDSSGQPPPDTVPAPCLLYSSWNQDYRDQLLAIPLQAYSGVPTGCEGVVTSKQGGTDVLITRHAETCVAGTANCSADELGRVYVQVSRCVSDVTRYVLGQTGTATFNLRQRDCNATPVATKRRYLANLYYIQSGDVPTLMRSTFDLHSGAPSFGTPQPMIEGIEAFRIELGIDNFNADAGAAVNYATGVRGDGIPDEYIHCGTGCTAEQLVDAVAAQIHVLVRSTRPTAGYTDTKTYQLGGQSLGPFNDQFKRHVFSTSVRFHNVSGRREVPADFVPGPLGTNDPATTPDPS